MKIFKLTLFLAVISYLPVFAQFHPAANTFGSNAIYKDSSIIVAWASECIISRGFIDFSDTSKTYSQNGITSNKAFFGESQNAIGYPNDINDVVSFGDGGSAILSFEQTITDGDGYDFAVFENGLKSQFTPFQYFLELAFVEVSTNGIDFVRFPATSLTQTEIQISSYGQINPENINNLAGKYIVDYGTPFDLSELKDSTKIDIKNINKIKIIDVVGSLNTEFSSIDNSGNKINDPFPTPFWTSGFDLAGVGIINTKQMFTIENLAYVYPNPFNDILNINCLENCLLELFNISGSIIFEKNLNEGFNQIILNELQKGLYIAKIFSENNINTFKIIKQ